MRQKDEDSLARLSRLENVFSFEINEIKSVLIGGVCRLGFFSVQSVNASILNASIALVRCRLQIQSNMLRLMGLAAT